MELGFDWVCVIMGGGGEGVNLNHTINTLPHSRLPHICFTPCSLFFCFRGGSVVNGIDSSGTSFDLSLCNASATLCTKVNGGYSNSCEKGTQNNPHDYSTGVWATLTNFNTTNG